MRHFKHELVLRDLSANVSQSRSLVFSARRWTAASSGSIKPKFTTTHRNLLIEMAFLRCFLGWERFLEESFILYLLGKKPRRRRRYPSCHVTPKSWKHANQLILPETGRSYVDWVNLRNVRNRANRFFANGEPFESALTPRFYMFDEMRVIRNAIAHRSHSSQNNFHNLVRSKLTYLPPKITVGEFLESPITGVHPPQTFLDLYLDGLQRTAVAIVP
jgi:hypothetical protein